MTVEKKAKADDEAIEKVKTLYNSVFANNDVSAQIASSTPNDLKKI